MKRIIKDLRTMRDICIVGGFINFIITVGLVGGVDANLLSLKSGVLWGLLTIIISAGFFVVAGKIDRKIERLRNKYDIC